jgi:hypothetical protein
VSTTVYIEAGPKKTFACALDWPGWCRSGKTEQDALDRLAVYAARYEPVAALAGVPFPKPDGSAGAAWFEVVERVTGSASTDFGVVSVPATADQSPLTADVASCLAAIVEAAWTIFDQVAAGAPALLRKGPRGGGRDRDKIIDHVLAAEASYVRKIGLKFPQPAPDDRVAIDTMRTAILDTLRSARSPVPDLPKGWPYRYAARRIAWHALDHAWEIEDRSDLSP